MATKSKAAAGRKRAPARRKTPKKAAPRTRGVQPEECRLESLPPEAASVADRIEREGGVLIAGYCEPLGRQPLLLAALPIESVEPTPFQRDLSDAHYKKLSGVIDRTGLFLDPVIAITAPGRGFWTPNGRHRLEAMRRLGAKTIVALVVPKREIAWQILALNTEKAHNLKERALEVIRIYKGLIEEHPRRAESDFAFYLEEAALVTLGLCYERKGNFGGGAYHPIVRRLETFTDQPLERALAVHERYADQLMKVDAAVAEVVARLKDRGLVSPYLRNFVVARVNPLRWIKDEPPPLEEVLGTMLKRLERFNVEKVNQQDLARAGGAPEPE
ncbi:MAG TPA: ParB N-terminal domain-containing protein [Steroidobacteraceae bacterium]